MIVLLQILYWLGKRLYENYLVTKSEILIHESYDHMEKSKKDNKGYNYDDDEDMKPVRFFPPLHIQRYEFVEKTINSYEGEIHKVRHLLIYIYIYI